MNEKILIIEDDEAIVNVLRRSLQYEKYLVSAASDGESGLKAFRENKPDLVILDWMLPMMDGLEVCQRIRAFSDTPILMLTAKDTLQDRVKGLDVGADDYLVKPFQLEELLARIRALLRRLQQEKTAVLTYGDLSLDTVTRLASRKGQVINLTAKEYDILEMFMRHPNEVMTRDVIFERIWGYNIGEESNVLDVYMRYLRQKVDDNFEPKYLLTIRGVGYVLRGAE